MSIPAWLASLLGLGAKPSPLVVDQVFESVEDVLAWLAKYGVPWAGTADDFVTTANVVYDLIQRGVIVPGQPAAVDGGHHAAGR